MGTDTKLYLKGKVKPDTILGVVRELFDKEATCKVAVSMSEAPIHDDFVCFAPDGRDFMETGTFTFNFNGHARAMFYIYHSVVSKTTLRQYIEQGLGELSKTDSTILNLSYNQDAVSIMYALIAKLGGGWLDENDCDGEGLTWVPADAAARRCGCELPSIVLDTMYRVPMPHSNAARMRGLRAEQVRVTDGRKYLKDEKGHRYEKDSLMTDENGNEFYLDFNPEYSSEYRLYLTSYAAESYLERERLLSQFLKMEPNVRNLSAHKLRQLISLMDE